MVFNVTQQWLEAHINVWQLFGYVNVLLSTGFLLFMGYKRGWDRTSWTLLVTSFVFGTGLGTMLLPSIMGALLGGLLLFLLAKYLLNFHHATADLSVIYMILFIGFGRLGCLFSGCCFGTPTNLPWGISYGLGNLSHWLHLHTGQIIDIYSPSLNIHPVQLYESLFLLLGALPAALQAMRRKIDGRLILSGFISGNFLFRFGIEFIRDMSNVWWSEVYLGPVSLFQIFLLCICALSLIYIIRLSMYPLAEISLSRHFSINPKKVTSPLLFTMIVGTILLSNHFQRIQIILLLVLLAGLVYLRVSTLLVSQSNLNLRFSPQTVGALGLLLLVSTNTFLASPDQKEAPLVSKSKWLYGINENNQKLVRIGDQNLSFERYTLINKRFEQVANQSISDSVAYVQGVADLNDPYMTYFVGGSAADYKYVVTGCGGESATHYIKQQGTLLGVEYASSPNRINSRYIGFRVDQLSQSEKIGTDDFVDRELNSLHLYSGNEGKYVGIGIGLSHTRDSWSGYPITPGAYLRLGPKTLFLEAGLNDRYQTLPGGSAFHVNIGMISPGNSHFQLGVATFGSDRGEAVAFIGLRNIATIPHFSLDLQGLRGSGGQVVLRYQP